MAKRMGVDVRLTRVLLQLGVMCAKLERFAEGELILRACKAYRDDLPHPSTSLALSFFTQHRFLEAEAELETALAAYPNHQLGKALLGITRRELDRKNWTTPLEEIVEDGRDEEAIKLARAALDAQPRSSRTGVGQPARTPASRRDVAAPVPLFPRGYA